MILYSKYYKVQCTKKKKKDALLIITLFFSFLKNIFPIFNINYNYNIYNNYKIYYTYCNLNI